MSGFGRYLDQARWLFDHQWRRADGFERKAIALLGFDGVLLGLLVNAASRFHARSVAVEALNAAATAAILVCAVACWSALRARRYASPGSEQLREEWAKHLKAAGSGEPPAAGLVDRDFAEFLLAHDDVESSPLASMKRDADQRAGCFEVASWAMMVAVVSVAGLLLALVWS